MLPNENVWITLMQKSIKMKEYIYLCNILILAIKYVIEREVNCFFLYISCQCEVTTVFSFWLHFHPDKENYENRNLRRLLDCYYFHLSIRKKNRLFFHLLIYLNLSMSVSGCTYVWTMLEWKIKWKRVANCPYTNGY